MGEMGGMTHGIGYERYLLFPIVDEYLSAEGLVGDDDNGIAGEKDMSETWDEGES